MKINMKQIKQPLPRVFIALILVAFSLVLIGCLNTSQNANTNSATSIINKSKNLSENPIVTITGTYQQSKAGGLVDGVTLINFEDDQYVGKIVEVTGEYIENHAFRCKPYVEGELASQCFDAPIMRNIKSIKVKN